MVESGTPTGEVLIAPVALPTEIGSGKIRNTALYRIQEALVVVMVGGILGSVVGLPAGGLLSIIRPGLGVYNLVPFAVCVAVGASVALVAELRHQSRSL